MKKVAILSALSTNLDGLVRELWALRHELGPGNRGQPWRRWLAHDAAEKAGRN